MCIRDRLSYLYRLTGLDSSADEYLNKSKIALEVMHGMSRCVTQGMPIGEDTPEDLYRAGRIGIEKNGEFISGDDAFDVFFKVCQENILYDYPASPDLDVLLDDPLLDRYRKARDAGT